MNSPRVHINYDVFRYMTSSYNSKWEWNQNDELVGFGLCIDSLYTC